MTPNTAAAHVKPAKNIVSSRLLMLLPIPTDHTQSKATNAYNLGKTITLIKNTGTKKDAYAPYRFFVPIYII